MKKVLYYLCCDTFTKRVTEPHLPIKQMKIGWDFKETAAVSESIILNPASGFRSYLYQKNLIQNHLSNGRSLADILKGSAMPGYSEHHTGSAVDIRAGPDITESEFHVTDTFAWMQRNAARYNFRLSYPKNNKYGLIFEPWHWLFIG